MITKRQTGAAPLIPRTRAGLCGTCSGKLVYDEDFASDKCRSCSRLAGPAPRSPEEVRQGILSELTTLAAEIIPPAQFWAQYVAVDDLAQVLGMTNKKNCREWLRYNGYLPERRRNPKSGKWADFLLIDTAKAAIRHRVG